MCASTSLRSASCVLSDTSTWWWSLRLVVFSCLFLSLFCVHSNHPFLSISFSFFRFCICALRCMHFVSFSLLFLTCRVLSLPIYPYHLSGSHCYQVSVSRQRLSAHGQTPGWWGETAERVSLPQPAQVCTNRVRVSVHSVWGMTIHSLIACIITCSHSCL